MRRSLTKVSLAQSLIQDSKGQEVGEIPGFDFLVDWYAKNVPTEDGEPGGGGIVHGDFKCDNMVSSSQPRPVPDAEIICSRSSTLQSLRSLVCWTGSLPRSFVLCTPSKMHSLIIAAGTPLLGPRQPPATFLRARRRGFDPQERVPPHCAP